MIELTKQQMSQYGDAVCALAESIANGAEVSELAEQLIADEFGLPVQMVCADVNDELCQMSGEARRYALEG